MAKTHSKAAPKSKTNQGSYESFVQALMNHPDTKRLNPHIKFVDGKFVEVPVEPSKVPPPLPDPGGKRLKRAVRQANEHALAVSQALVVFAAMECGDMPPLENFDQACISDIVKALAIRSSDLNSALLSAANDNIDASELESLVRGS